MSRPAVESTLFRARRRLTEEYDDIVSGARCVRIQGIIVTAAQSAAGHARHAPARPPPLALPGLPPRGAGRRAGPRAVRAPDRARAGRLARRRAAAVPGAAQVPPRRPPTPRRSARRPGAHGRRSCRCSPITCPAVGGRPPPAPRCSSPGGRRRRRPSGRDAVGRSRPARRGALRARRGQARRRTNAREGPSAPERSRQRPPRLDRRQARDRRAQARQAAQAGHAGASGHRHAGHARSRPAGGAARSRPPLRTRTRPSPRSPEQQSSSSERKPSLQGRRQRDADGARPGLPPVSEPVDRTAGALDKTVDRPPTRRSDGAGRHGRPWTTWSTGHRRRPGRRGRGRA